MKQFTIFESQSGYPAYNGLKKAVPVETEIGM
jgi:hypothetical protein